MKKIFLYVLLISSLQLFAQPANDDCIGATALTVNGALLCSQTNNSATLEAGECYFNGSGNESSVWYRFTATQTNMILNFILTNSPSCSMPLISVAGPFASVAAGCGSTGVFNSGCGGSPYYNFQTLNNYQGVESSWMLESNGDSGNHLHLTGLTVGGIYLIRIQGATAGGILGCGTTAPTYCIGVATAALNGTLPGATGINACGVTFSGTTDGGYWNNGTENGGGFGNLDNNNGTTCGTCTSGDDVPYVINNASFYTFCQAAAGTWNIRFAVSSCILPAAGGGSQISIFTGTPNSLSSVWVSPTSCGGTGIGQVPTGCTVTSSNFSVPAGGCTYVAVDGFAGDACDYTIVLTNVTGGCTILPVDLTSFSAECSGDKMIFQWETGSEKNSDYFTLEKSEDGNTFYPIKQIKSSGNSSMPTKYLTAIYDVPSEITYYRLSQTDFDGASKVYEMVAVAPCGENESILASASNNQIKIVTALKNEENDFNIALFDLQGRLVLNRKEKIPAGKYEFTLPASIKNGIYFLKIYNEKKVLKTLKVSIQN